MPQLAFQDYFAIVSAITGVVLAAMFSGHKKWRLAAGLAVLSIVGAAAIYFIFFRPKPLQSDFAKAASLAEDNDRAQLSAALRAAMALEDPAKRDGALLKVIRLAGRRGYLEYADSAQGLVTPEQSQAAIVAEIDGMFDSRDSKLCARAVEKIELVKDATVRDALRERAASGAGCVPAG